MKDFKVGMAKADVTPELDCLLYGYPMKRFGKKVRDNLSVGAVAISQDGQTILLISAEVCNIDSDLCLFIRKRISEKTNVKWENILYAAIHTHSGPCVRNSVGWGEINVDYVEQKLIPASIEAACKALEGMKPAVMGIGTTESKAGINRREVSPEGKIMLGQNPAGPYDPTMTVISFQTQEGEKIGSIVHFAAHPTAAGQNSSITRDWPGEMIDRIEEITDAPCMFINGAEGDVGPRLQNGKTTGDEGHLKWIGDVAADDAEKAYRNIVSFEIPIMSVVNDHISFPFQETPSLEEVEQQMKELESQKEMSGINLARYSKLQKIKEYYDSGTEFPRDLKIQQTVIALEDLAMVPFPFEAFCNIALSLKEKSPYRSTLLLGLTGGTYGYLPTEDQLPYGGYEVDVFRVAGGSALSFADNTDKTVVDQNVKLLQKMVTIQDTP